MDVIAAWSAVLAAASITAAPPERGISESLANERAQTIQSVRYDLTFRIPERKADSIRASVVVRFTLHTPHRVVLDFEQPRDHVQSVEVNGAAAQIDFANGHLIVPVAATRPGENAVRVDFIAGDDSLNRNDDYLYTLFVPARAHLAFPCFDQPNLKGRYQLSLEIPASWRAVANGAELDPKTISSELTAFSGPGRRVIRFAETRPLPTYLFAFAAGKFQVETSVRDGRTFHMYHRETDAAKVARNRDAIPAIAERADKFVRIIVDTYGLPNKTVPELRAMLDSGALDPLRDFSESCREELRQLTPLGTPAVEKAR